MKSMLMGLALVATMLMTGCGYEISKKPTTTVQLEEMNAVSLDFQFLAPDELPESKDSLGRTSKYYLRATYGGHTRLITAYSESELIPQLKSLREGVMYNFNTIHHVRLSDAHSPNTLTTLQVQSALDEVFRIPVQLN